MSEIRAGKAWAEKFAKLPPEAQAAHRANMKASFSEFRPQLEAAWAKYDEARRELESYGFRRLPDNLDDWEELAAITGIDDWGEWTAGEIVEHARVWARRELVKAKIGERAKLEVAAERDPFLTIDQFCEAVGWWDGRRPTSTWDKKQNRPESALKTGKAKLSEWRTFAEQWPLVLRKLNRSKTV